MPTYGIVKTKEYDDNEAPDIMLTKLLIGKIIEIEVIDLENYKQTAKFKGEKGTAIPFNTFIL